MPNLHFRISGRQITSPSTTMFEEWEESLAVPLRPISLGGRYFPVSKFFTHDHTPGSILFLSVH